VFEGDGVSFLLAFLAYRARRLQNKKPEQPLLHRLHILTMAPNVTGPKKVDFARPTKIGPALNELSDCSAFHL